MAFGSSPLARGLLLLSFLVVVMIRIIPARAGFTVGDCGRAQDVGDHPRSRGVYADLAAAGAVEGGSSPLARGLHAAAAIERLRGGIIPARAGFTRVRDRVDDRALDHPRSRGVYRHGRRHHGWRRGSSPLARGLLRVSLFAF